MGNRWIIYCALLWPVSLCGQDWLRNGDLEDENTCVEFQATCAPEFWYHLPMGVEAKMANPPAPHSGKRMEQLCWEHIAHPINYRTYVVTPIVCPLVAGEKYTLSLFLYTDCTTPFELGVRAMRSWPGIYYDSLLTEEPTLAMTVENQFSIEKSGWRALRASFVAKGGEGFLVLGNFRPTPQTRSPKDRSRQKEIAYLLDDIRLTASDPPECPERERRRAYFYHLDIRHTNPDSTLLARMVEETAPPPPLVEEIAEVTRVVMADTPAQHPPEFVISDIGFESGSYQLNALAEPYMQACAAQIREQQPVRVVITGYTDDKGSEAFNRDLSEKRAEAVRQWLTGRFALDPALFVVQGMGENAPIAPNDTEEGRRANRRVEIKFLYR